MEKNFLARTWNIGIMVGLMGTVAIGTGCDTFSSDEKVAEDFNAVKSGGGSQNQGEGGSAPTEPTEPGEVGGSGPSHPGGGGSPDSPNPTEGGSQNQGQGGSPTEPWENQGGSGPTNPGTGGFGPVDPLCGDDGSIDGNANGTIEITNQEMLNRLSVCSTLQADLSIRDSSDIVDLSPLLNLLTVNHSLLIHNNRSLTSLAGLNNLSSLSGFLEISSNPELPTCQANKFVRQVDGESSVTITNNGHATRRSDCQY